MKKIFLLIFLVCNLSLAQEQKTSSFWAEAGIGLTFLKFSNANAGFNFLGSLNYEIQNNNFKLSYLHAEEILSFDHPNEYVRSIELKYGRSIDFTMRGLLFPFFPFLLIIKRDFHYSLIGRIGVSYNEGLERTKLLSDEFFDNKFDSKVIAGFGLPLEIELRQEITFFLGMGISIYANINKVKNYSGINFSLYVGKF